MERLASPPLARDIAVAFDVGSPVEPLRAADGGTSGQIITAADMTLEVNDAHQLLPMMAQAEVNSGVAADVTLADTGYHSGANVGTCAEQGRTVVIPDQQQTSHSRPYHKEQFAYDSARDTYTCPAGQVLSFFGSQRDRNGDSVRRYRAAADVCVACPAFGICTRDRRNGRTVRAGPYDAALRAHRAWQASEEARWLSAVRRWLIEPVFSVIKDQQAARRLLLRGAANVQAEWCWLATTFNLRMLARAWQRRRPPRLPNTQPCRTFAV